MHCFGFDYAFIGRLLNKNLIHSFILQMLMNVLKRRTSVLTNVRMCLDHTNVCVHVDLKLMRMEECAKVGISSVGFKGVSNP